MAGRVTFVAIAAGLGALGAAMAMDPPPTSQRPGEARTPAASSAPASKRESPLPNGASSLQETYGDWQVACLAQAGDKRCGALQEQTNAQTRQRIFAMEAAPIGDRIEAVLVMSFGLALDQGVTLQIDDFPPRPALKFRTCVAGGCLVPVAFDANQSALLKGAKVLKAKVTVDGGGEMEFSLSLNGLATALERVAALR